MQIFQKKNKQATRTVVIDSLKYKTEKLFWPLVFQSILLYITLIGFLLCVATSVDMTIGFGAISLISFCTIVVAILFSLNSKVFISFLSIFGVAAISIMIFAKNLFAKIIDAFVFCYNLTIQIMVEQGYTNYESSMTTDITESLSNDVYMTECFYTVIIVLAILFSILFSLTLIKRALIWMAAVPCFLVLTPSLYFGSTPSGIAFSIFISGILGCYAENISKVSKKRNKIKNEDKKEKNTFELSFNTAANGFSCMCVSLLLSLSLSFALFSSEGFQIDSIRKVIDDLAQKAMNVMFYKNYETAEGAVGGLLNGNILELKTPEFRNLPVMTVTTKTKTPLYLRGWIGDDLLEDGWKVLDKEDTDQYDKIVNDSFDETTQYFNYLKIVSDFMTNVNTPEDVSKLTKEETEKLGFVYDSVNFKAKFTKSLMVFVPVRCIDGKINAKNASVITTGDTISFFENKRPKNNQYSYEAVIQSFSDRDFYLSIDRNLKVYNSLYKMVSDKSDSLSNKEQKIYDFITAEKKYYDYVKSKYLSVPEKSETLYQLAKEITSDYSQNFAKALAIEKYFKTEYKYAQSFTHSAGGAMQKVNYMIRETKTGYCTYFATAMTVMMRQLGIPARYVTGYHAKSVSDADNTGTFVREIDDKNYHAWVEVYFEGMGWLTFDPTPGTNSSEQLRDYDYLDDPEISEEEPIEDDIPEEDEEPPVITQPPPPSVNVNDIPMEVYIDIPLWVIIAAFIIAVSIIILIILMAVMLIIKSRFKSFINNLHGVAPTNLVKMLYPKIMILFKSLGYVPSPGEMMIDFAQRVDKQFELPVTMQSVLSTLEMSQFSQNEIETIDAAAVLDMFTLLYTSVFYSLNIFKKYYYMNKIIEKIKV